VDTITLKFEIPSTSADKAPQMARGYSNRFLLLLMERMALPVPDATYEIVFNTFKKCLSSALLLYFDVCSREWASYQAALDLHRASLALPPSSSSPVAKATVDASMTRVGPASDFTQTVLCPVSFVASTANCQLFVFPVFLHRLRKISR
jgi:hypothetical protein